MKKFSFLVKITRMYDVKTPEELIKVMKDTVTGGKS